MPFMEEKFCAIRWRPPTTLKKNTHLMLYKPFLEGSLV
jgi:hypothetical protein